MLTDDSFKTGNSQWISGWIDRMAAYWGPQLSGHGRSWDWGQALCVHQYGLDSNTWPDDPSDVDIQVAALWEEGDWPAWINI